MTLFGKAARALAWLLVQAPAPLLPTTSSVVHSQTVEVGGVYKSDEAESVRMGSNQAPREWEDSLLRRRHANTQWNGNRM